MIAWRDVRAVLDEDVERRPEDGSLFPGAYTNTFSRYRAGGFSPDDFGRGRRAREAMCRELSRTEDYLEMLAIAHGTEAKHFVLRPGESHRSYRPSLATKYEAERAAIKSVRSVLERELWP